jgi:hypothetical protein
MDEITPLFICGMGRSGTTNALRVLNTHPSVMLNGEISLSVLNQFFALLDGVERSYAEKDDTLEGWRKRKIDYMFESFGYLSKGGRGQLKKLPAARFRGHKTPRLETLFEKYEAHFRGSGYPPRYIYCARNPFDCWRSYKATSWNRHDGVTEFLAQYMASFERLKVMQEHADGRVFVLKLDDLIAASDAAEWYRDRLFTPLGLDMPERTRSRIREFDEEKRTSSSAPALSSEEKKAITQYPGLETLIETMFENLTPAPS